MEKKKTLDFLDGHRGFLAYVVLLNHLAFMFGIGVIHLFEWTGYYIGVVGFFVLSSFLLTYRLMIDFRDVKSFRDGFVKTTQYAIRRFFRIYVVFVIYWTLCHFGPSNFSQPFVRTSFSNYSSGLILSSVGGNHLWTIPIEIKYYFFIPIISFVSVKSGKYWIILWLFSSLFVIYVEIFNSFSLTPDVYSDGNVGLGPRFTIFFSGSLLAIIFFNFENIPAARAFTIKPRIRILLSISLNILFLGQFLLFSYKIYLLDLSYFKHSYISAIYQVSMILLLLYVNETNTVAKFYSSYFLRTSGHYSFGIYLFHATVIHIFKTSANFIPIAYHKYIFQFSFQRAFVVVGLSYLCGLIWFYAVENSLIKVASKLSKLIDAKSSESSV
jgi:peptidoglycan/LPS O-acetylase OafA/YrhL